MHVSLDCISVGECDGRNMNFDAFAQMVVMHLCGEVSFPDDERDQARRRAFMKDRGLVSIHQLIRLTVGEEGRWENERKRYLQKRKRLRKQHRDDVRAGRVQPRSRPKRKNDARHFWTFVALGAVSTAIVVVGCVRVATRVHAAVKDSASRRAQPSDHIPVDGMPLDSVDITEDIKDMLHRAGDSIAGVADKLDETIKGISKWW